MTRTTAAFLAVCGLPLVASAVVNTRVDWQVSTDFEHWSSDVVAHQGQEVFVRALVTYTGTQAPLGLASMNFQPIVSNWDAAGPSIDQAVVANCLAPPHCEVQDPLDPTQFGRVIPFQRAATGTNGIHGHVHIDGSGGAPLGTWLRIALTTATAWCGGSGNTAGSGGVNIGQLANVGRTTSDPAFAAELFDIQVYRFGIFLSTDAAARTLTIDSPASCFGNRNTNGDREVYWWGNMNESSGSIRGTPLIVPATIHVQPCGSADFNCDGDIGTDADIEAFFACLAGNCPAAPCPWTADFNGDGDVGTDADIEAFFRVLAGGAC